MFYKMDYNSPIGVLTVASDGKNIVGLWTAGQKYFGGGITGEMIDSPERPELKAARDWLDRYFAGKKPPATELPLAPNGGEFRQAVWDILLKIPYGKVITYGDIAKEIAAKQGKDHMSAQAVGGAVGHNPVSIIIPCHRVVGKRGSLTGYAGGIDKKIKLLTLEGVDISQLSVPKKGSAL